MAMSLLAKFNGAIAKIAGGTFIGHIILLGAAPILTRLYQPSEFGIFAACIAAASIVGYVISLRYEQAIPIAVNDAEAFSLFASSIFIAVLNTIIIYLILIFSLVCDFRIFKELYILVIPILCLLNGFISILIHNSLRERNYNEIAKSRPIMVLTQVIVQIVLGSSELGVESLLSGYAIGLIFQIIYLCYCGSGAYRQLWHIYPFVFSLTTLRNHWRYPAFVAPSSMLNGSTQHLPSILITFAFGPALAGFFALAQRTVGLPVRLVSYSASQVFLGTAPSLPASQQESLFLQVSVLFLVVGLCGSLIAVFTAPTLFAWLFGEEWRYAGYLVILLLPAYTARFFTVPVSQILIIIGKQSWHLYSSVFGIIVLFGSFGLGYLNVTSPEFTILIYSLSWGLVQICTWMIAWMALSNSNKKQANNT